MRRFRAPARPRREREGAIEGGCSGNPISTAHRYSRHCGPCTVPNEEEYWPADVRRAGGFLLIAFIDL